MKTTFLTAFALVGALSACSTSFPSSGEITKFDGYWKGEIINVVEHHNCYTVDVEGEVRYGTLVGFTKTKSGRKTADFGGTIESDGTFDPAWVMGVAGFESDVTFTEDKATGVWELGRCNGTIEVNKVGKSAL